MGLLKETMQAIIRIDRNLNRLCNPLVADTSNISKKEAAQIRDEFSGRVLNNKAFDYPANLTLGGRFAAIREYRHLKQHEVAQILRVTPSYVSRFESDKAIPSGTLIRFASQHFNINETWLATGHLPQTNGEQTGNMSQTDPTLQKLRGTYFRYDPKELLKESMDRVHQTRLEVQEELGIQEDSR